MNLKQKAADAARSLSPEEARDLEVPEGQMDKLSNLSNKQLRVLEQRGAAALGTSVEEYKAGQTMTRIRGFAVGLVVVGVTLTVGLKITSEVGSQINDTEAQQGATDATNGLSELSGFLPIIGLVVAAAAVIGLVSGSFGGGMRGRA
jgi:hypothetical protein